MDICDGDTGVLVVVLVVWDVTGNGHCVVITLVGAVDVMSDLFALH